MKKYFGYFLGLLVALALTVPALVGTSALAQTDTGVDAFFGGDTTFVDSSGLGSEDDLPAMIGGLIQTAMGFLGIVAVVIVLIGGFLWMTAAGDDKKVESAKKLLGAGVIGLIIIMAAYAITAFVLSQLSTTTGTLPTTE